MAANSNTAIAIKQFCTKIAADPLLVQGASGNVSWKNNQVMHVTASGSWLAKAATQEIFVAVDYHHLQQAIKQQDFTVTPRVIHNSGLRPSIETLLHAVLPHKVVVHLHPVAILAHLVRTDQINSIKRIIGQQLAWAYIAYCQPGAILATAVAAALKQYPATNVLFLGNHGIVIGGDTIASIDATLTQLLSLMHTPVQHLSSSVQQTQPIAALNAHGYSPHHNKNLAQLAIIPHLITRLRHSWALYPDQLVFLGAQAAILTLPMNLTALAKIIATKPPFIFVIGRGVFTSNTVQPAQLLQLDCYFNILLRQSTASKLLTLDQEQIAAIVDWEAERYRQQQNTVAQQFELAKE